MKILVDYENVNSIGLEGIKGLSKNDDIFIFYTDASRISFDMHRTIENLECKKDYQKITSDAQNALVFLLSTIIGRLIASDSKSPYSIISKDTGFDVIIQYWKGLGIRIDRYQSIKEAFDKNADVITAAEEKKPVEEVKKPEEVKPAAVVAPAVNEVKEPEKKAEVVIEPAAANDDEDEKEADVNISDEMLNELFSDDNDSGVDIDNLMNTRL